VAGTSGSQTARRGRGAVRERYPVFDSLRIVAAVVVIFSHAFPLSGHPEPVVTFLGDYGLTFGALAVATFFIISGFLITMSWNLSPRAVPYSVKRFARIWPAFVVVVVLAAFVLGPLVTTLSVREYFADPGTWSYVAHNVVMSPIKYRLPGVFETLPHRAVNGSLWTLPYEVLAYVGVLLLGYVGLMKKRAVVLTMFVVALVLFRLDVASHQLHVNADVGGMTFALLLGLGMWFLAGAAMYVFRDRVPWSLPVATVALGLAVLGAVAGEALLFVAGFAYLVVFVGTRQWHPLEQVHRLGDPSYGIYLYAFPIQQLLVMAGVHGAWSLFLAATPITVVFGYASWHVVERPGMRRLRNVGRRAAPRVAAPGSAGAVPEDVT
jgi:peptidoglycan/LPS O-acetylase OafA/YrhL